MRDSCLICAAPAEAKHVLFRGGTAPVPHAHRAGEPQEVIVAVAAAFIKPEHVVRCRSREAGGFSKSVAKLLVKKDNNILQLRRNCFWADTQLGIINDIY